MCCHILLIYLFVPLLSFSSYIQLGIIRITYENNAEIPVLYNSNVIKFIPSYQLSCRISITLYDPRQSFIRYLSHHVTFAKKPKSYSHWSPLRVLWSNQKTDHVTLSSNNFLTVNNWDAVIIFPAIRIT
jgi:prepilin signal peptidase PulO-like enzyme (type II secretory pathway)